MEDAAPAACGFGSSNRAVTRICLSSGVRARSLWSAPDRTRGRRHRKPPPSVGKQGAPATCMSGAKARRWPSESKQVGWTPRASSSRVTRIWRASTPVARTSASCASGWSGAMSRSRSRSGGTTATTRRPRALGGRDLQQRRSVLHVALGDLPRRAVAHRRGRHSPGRPTSGCRWQAPSTGRAQLPRRVRLTDGRMAVVRWRGESLGVAVHPPRPTVTCGGGPAADLISVSFDSVIEGAEVVARRRDDYEEVRVPMARRCNSTRQPCRRWRL